MIQGETQVCTGMPVIILVNTALLCARLDKSMHWYISSHLLTYYLDDIMYCSNSSYLQQLKKYIVKIDSF